MYQKNIDEYVKNGYAKKLTPEEMVKRMSKAWYLPHHGVVNINRPGKSSNGFRRRSKIIKSLHWP